MTRIEALDRVKSIFEERAKTHGAFESNCRQISSNWNAQFDTEFSDTDICIAMALMKIARIKSNTQGLDSWLDAIGYLALGVECATAPQDS